MPDRIQISVPQAYLTVDGQPQIVLSGSVIDVTNAAEYAGAAVIIAETAGTIPANQKAASVRNVRRK